MRRIAAAAGMSTMNVYSRFGGKDGVLDELFIDGFRRLGDEMGEPPDDRRPDRRPAAVRRGATGAFAREQPDLLLADVRPRRCPTSCRPSGAVEAALGALGQRRGAGRAGDGRRRASRRATRSRSPPALWACEHGLVVARGPHADGRATTCSTGTPSSTLTVDALHPGSRLSGRDPGRVRVPRPTPVAVTLVVLRRRRPSWAARRCARDGDDWVGEVAEGTVYGLVAEGDGPALRPVEGAARPAGHGGVVPARPRPRAGAASAACRTPGAARSPSPGGRAAAAAAAAVEPRPRRLRGPRPRADPARRRSTRPGTFAALVDAAARGWPRSASPSSSCCRCTRTTRRRAATGATCRSPSAPSTASTPPATTPPASSPTLVAAAHDHDIEVWLDVVFNHTTEVDATGPTYSLRGLVRRRRTTGCARTARTSRRPGAATTSTSRRRSPRTSSCGRSTGSPTSASTASASTSPPCSPATPASSTASTGGPAARGVRMIAEPWDAVGTLPARPGVAGRGVAAVERPLPRRRPRVPARRARARRRAAAAGAGQPRPVRRRRWRASTSSPATTGSRCTTSSPTTASTTRPTARAAGTGPTTTARGTAAGRATTARPPRCSRCGAGSCATRGACWRWPTACRCSPMGDEFGRTQGGNNNAYNQDNETSWVDWERAAEFADLERFVGRLLALRHRHPVLVAAGLVGRRRAVVRHRRPADLGPHVALAGVVRRRPLRHGQRVVGAAGVPRSRRRARGAASSTHRCLTPTSSSRASASGTRSGRVRSSC